MKRLLILIIIELFLLENQIYSQNIDTIGLYKFESNIKIVETIKKELDILMTYSPEEDAFGMHFYRQDNCDDTLFIVGLHTSIYRDKILGILFYRNLHIYIEGDTLLSCKLNIFLEKIKDTVINKNNITNKKKLNIDIYEEENLNFDDVPQKILTWDNIFLHDKFAFFMPYYEFFLEYDFFKIKSNYLNKHFRKKICSVGIKKVNLNKEIDSITHIYFTYHKINDTVFNFNVFYPLIFNNELKYLSQLIIEKLKRQNQLKDGYYYIGEAIIRDKKMQINFTYLVNCKE